MPHQTAYRLKEISIVYRVLDAEGNKVGVPIKASSIYSKPTLAELEKRFLDNKTKRKSARLPLRDKLNIALEKAASLQEFIRELRKIGVDTVLRQNDTGLIYGITFVDHSSKSVFKGSDVGDSYSAAAIQQRIISAKQNTVTQVSATEEITLSEKTADIKIQKEKTIETDFENPVQEHKGAGIKDLLEDLMQAEKGGGNVPYELRKKKRKKRKRKPRL